jgi:hypothetical protein
MAKVPLSITGVIKRDFRRSYNYSLASGDVGNARPYFHAPRRRSVAFIRFRTAVAGPALFDRSRDHFPQRSTVPNSRSKRWPMRRSLSPRAPERLQSEAALPSPGPERLPTYT